MPWLPMDSFAPLLEASRRRDLQYAAEEDQVRCEELDQYAEGLRL